MRTANISLQDIFNEITLWLSGEHNFTISTLAMLSTFFGKPIITVG